MLACLQQPCDPQMPASPDTTSHDNTHAALISVEPAGLVDDVHLADNVLGGGCLVKCGMRQEAVGLSSASLLLLLTLHLQALVRHLGSSLVSSLTQQAAVTLCLVQLLQDRTGTGVLVRFQGLGCAGVGLRARMAKECLPGQQSVGVNKAPISQQQTCRTSDGPAQQHCRLLITHARHADSTVPADPASITNPAQVKSGQHTCRTGRSAHTCIMRLSSDASRLRWQWPRLSIRMVLGIKV